MDDKIYMLGSIYFGCIIFANSGEAEEKKKSNGEN